MKNNELGNIALGTGSKKKSRFNLSHDVNSTYQFGEVQPVLFRDMIAGEKDVVDIESMVRMAPMVAPTFGRILHKEWHHFIPITDLFPHYGNFVAQTSYRNQVPTKLPSMSLAFLSYMCLAGSKMTIYEGPSFNQGDAGDPDIGEYVLLRQPSLSQTTTAVDNLLAHIAEHQGLPNNVLAFNFTANDSSSAWNATSFNTIELRHLMNPALLYYLYGQNYAYNQSMKMPIANWDPTSWFDFVDKSMVTDSQFTYVTDVDSVSLDSADAVIPYNIGWNNGGNRCTLLLAFRFSNFGKRLYKILNGIGYCLDFESTQYVSLLPLFAYYKAWFDEFGITRSLSWTDTTAYKLLNMFDYAPTNWDFNQVFCSSVGSYYSFNDWIKFIVELGNCWVTEDVDFVSSHFHDQPSVNPNTISNNSPLMFDVLPPDPNTSSNVQIQVSNASLSGGFVNPNPRIRLNATPAYFSALKIKELMQMYRWLNRNSVAGRSAEDILRAQGYGYFLYSCKSNFIGYTEQHVQVYDVVSQSDTFNSSSDDGALLGQYAGRGLGYEKSKTMTFEADEDGYWIGLCAIVPKSGYSQSLNPSLVAIDKFSRYNPDLDGKYMTLSPKSFVRGNKPFSAFSMFDDLKTAFGFIPIYSGLKIGQNVSNGGFSLRSQSKIFEPYMLDKVIDVGERQISLKAENSVSASFIVAKRFKQLPTSGEFWRYLCRYQWLGNLDRIFARSLVNGEQLNIQWQSQTPSDSSYEYLITSDDNFMVHHVVNQIAYSPMLPIEESFQTEDEDGNFDSSVEMQ